MARSQISMPISEAIDAIKYASYNHSFSLIEDLMYRILSRPGEAGYQDIIEHYIAAIDLGKVRIPPKRICKLLLENYVDTQSTLANRMQSILKSGHSVRLNSNYINDIHIEESSFERKTRARCTHSQRGKLPVWTISFEFANQESRFDTKCKPEDINFDIHLNGQVVYITRTGKIHLLNSSGQQVASAQLPEETHRYFRYDVARCIKFSQDGNSIYVSGQKTVYKYNERLIFASSYTISPHEGKYTWAHAYFNKASSSSRKCTDDSMSTSELKSCLQTLGIPNSDLNNRETISSAYRTRIMMCHPDLHPELPEAHNLTIELNIAYAKIIEYWERNYSTMRLPTSATDPLVPHDKLQDRIQHVHPLSNGAIVSTYLGQIYSIEHGVMSPLEEVFTWTSLVRGSRHQRVYTGVCSTIFSADGCLPFETPGRVSCCDSNQTHIAASQGRRIFVFTNSGSMVFDAEVSREVKSIRFTRDLLSASTNTKTFTFSVKHPC